ncbi:MAG: hypothetical protein AAFZ01_07220 [Pseudomonadota bacterium]
MPSDDVLRSALASDGGGGRPDGARRGFLAWMAQSTAMRLVLIALIVFAMVLLPRPSQPVAVLLCFGVAIRVAAYRNTHEVMSIAGDTAWSVLPAFCIFLVAALATTATAFQPGSHLMQTGNALAAQMSVVVFFILGRLAGRVPLRRVFWWVFLTVAATVALLLIEDERFIARHAIGMLDKPVYFSPSALNRAFLLTALALSFFLVLARSGTAFTGEAAGRRAQAVGMALAAVGLLLAITVVSNADAARLVLLIALVGVFLSAAMARGLLAIAIGLSFVLMIAGPFVYEAAMEVWKASPLADYKRYTFLARLESWADFGALVRESHFFGRGLNVSKAIAQDPSLFAMPNVPCGEGVIFCPWHPHNAALQVVTDLGFLGIAWFMLVLWQVRGLVVRGIAPWLQPAVATLLLGFLAASFVTEGLWPWWWWLSAGMIALWLGVLVENGADGETRAEQKKRAAR